MEMQLTSILQMTEVYSATQQLKMIIERMQSNCWVYYYRPLADTVKYIVKDIVQCIIKEQCSDTGENTSKW